MHREVEAKLLPSVPQTSRKAWNRVSIEAGRRVSRDYDGNDAVLFTWRRFSRCTASSWQRKNAVKNVFSPEYPMYQRGQHVQPDQCSQPVGGERVQLPQQV